MAHFTPLLTVIDFETDPFLHSRIPAPFAAGLYDGADFHSFWGDDCVARLVAWLMADRSPRLIYAHNGGKFDFVFMLDALSNPIRIVRGRILSARLGPHELRDSYPLIPVALDKFEKQVIDYRLFEREVRDRHRAAITDYLRSDCLNLHRLVCGFRDRFGDRLTIGAAALRELRALHPFVDRGPFHDARFRPFYFGGRVECFEYGHVRGSLACYDVNSMYPATMHDDLHPIGGRYSLFGSLDGLLRWGAGRPYFVRWKGLSLGAMPLRDERGRLVFPHGPGEFACTHHEFETALELGLIHPDEATALVCEESITFDTFVDQFNQEKIDAESRGDKLGRLAAKLTSNNAYGKLSTNPANYKDWFIRTGNTPPPQDDASRGPVPFDRRWHPLHAFEGGEIWGRASTRPRYVDVATGASITGAARARLLRAIAGARRPIYCDTDSLICEALGDDMDIHPTRLGAWKCEARLDELWIAGKKLYAGSLNGQCVKVASKGFDIQERNENTRRNKLLQIIRDIVNGSVYTHLNDAPNFKLDGTARFVQRTITSTIGA